MTQFEDVLETILEEYARRDSEGEFDTWEETDAFVKEKAEVLLAYVKEEPVSEELEEAANAYISNENNYSHSRTDTFKAGAKWQAEKDLELTWEDIKEICDITFEEACRLQRNMKGSLIYKKQHYQEVLKRFKAQKGEKV